MNRQAANPDQRVSSPRRFILLPEEPVDGARQGRRIRRYQLTSLPFAGTRGPAASRRRGRAKPADVAVATGVRALAQRYH